jgi:Tol biopolymer transport system component
VRGAIAVAAAAVALAAPSLAATPGPPARGEWVSFWTSTGVPSVWLMRPDGTRRHSLTSGGTSAKAGVLSPDGRWIVCYGAQAFATRGTRYDFDIQLMRRDGTGRRFLTRTRARDTDPRWSPDGRWIFFSRTAGESAPRSIWKMRSDGSEQTRIHGGTGARPSPDGRLLLFGERVRGQWDLAVLDRRNGRIRRLTFTAADESAGGWSPDGRRIVFTRFPRSSPEADVYVADADGRHVLRLTRARGHDTAAGWSPDGTRILFTSERDGRPQVYVMNADGSGPRNVSRSSLDETATTWQRVPVKAR